MQNFINRKVPFYFKIDHLEYILLKNIALNVIVAAYKEKILQSL